MTARTPRCAKPMILYKGGVKGMTECGRPQGHPPGKCRSREAVSRYAKADARRITAKRRADALEGRSRKRNRTGRRLHPPVAVPASPGELSTCGTYLAYLLHLDRGQSPCLRCSLAAVRKQTAQAARSDLARAA